MKRNLKFHVDGLQMGDPLPFVEKKLKDMENGSTLYYTALNGHNLLIKENNIVRDSTDKEWVKYHKKGNNYEM